MNLFTINIIIIFSLSIFTSLIFLKIFIKYALKNNLLDKPDSRKLHINATPSSGGMVFGLISLIILPSFIESFEILTLMCCSLSLLFIGYLDDRYDLSAKLKFIPQFILASIILNYLGPIEIIETNTFSINHIVTFLFIIGFTNSFNLIDGVDGLSGLYGVFVLIVLTILLILTEHLELAIISIALIGSLIGFLRYNLNQAKIFMGDTGTLFLGFLISGITIIIIQSQTKLPGILIEAYNIHILLLSVLALPMSDTLRVMTMRIFKGTSPFKADRSHLHHLLGKIGLGALGITLIFFSIAVFITTLTYFLIYWNFNNLFVLFVLASTQTTLFNFIIYLRLLKHKKSIMQYQKSLEFILKTNNLIRGSHISSIIK